MAAIRRILGEHSFKFFIPRRRIGDQDIIACVMAGISASQLTAAIIRPMRRRGVPAHLEIIFIEHTAHGVYAYPWHDVEVSIRALCPGRVAFREYAYNDGACRPERYRWEELVARADTDMLAAMRA